jgi:diguanylate cyclase (GGDEF)-like protein
LRGRILLGFATPLALVIVAWAILYGCLVVSVTATRSIAETDDVVDRMRALSRTAADAESGQRAYVLTGSPEYLDAFRPGADAFGPAAAALERMMEGKPEQRRRVEKMSRLFETWRSEVAIPAIDARSSTPPRVSDASQQAYLGIVGFARELQRRGADAGPARRKLDEVRNHVRAAAAEEVDPEGRVQWKRAMALLDQLGSARGGGAVAERLLGDVEAILREEAEGNRSADSRSRDLVASSKGRKLVDELTAASSEFIEAEKTFIERQVRLVARAVRIGKAVALIGPFVALALALWGMLASSVGIANAVAAIGRAAQGLAAGDLTQRVPVERDDEVGRLARAFNTMAERLERRGREQALLREMGDLLHSCRTLQEAFDVAPRLLEGLFPGSRGAILVMNAERKLLDAAAVWGSPAPDAGAERLVDAQDCWALRRGRSHVSRSDGSTPVCSHLYPGAWDASFCIPLTAQVETLGVLTMVGGETGADFGRETGPESPHGLAEIVAERLALAVANLRLQDTLREQSVRDPLTGLFNRRYMEETLAREIHGASRQGGSLSLVMLDVDHFKPYNDRYGHEAGDALLRELGVWLASQLRQGDVPCRYGGEEFVLILPGASLDGTLARAERLREAVRLLRVQRRDQVLDPITVSLGVATYPLHGATADDLLRAADVALYRAKADGRNRVGVPA